MALMPRKSNKKESTVFISHSSADLCVAQDIEAALHGAGFDVWLDRSDIRVGVLLGKESEIGSPISRQVK